MRPPAVAGEVVAFRVPHPNVATVGGWIGLSPAESVRLLPDLPTGHGLARDPETGAIRPIAPNGPPSETPPQAWSDAVAASRQEFRPETAVGGGEEVDDPATEKLLLAVLAGEESARPLGLGEIPTAAQRLPGVALDAALLEDRARSLARRGYVDLADGRARLSPPASDGWG